MLQRKLLKMKRMKSPKPKRNRKDAQIGESTNLTETQTIPETVSTANRSTTESDNSTNNNVGMLENKLPDKRNVIKSVVVKPKLADTTDRSSDDIVELRVQHDEFMDEEMDMSTKKKTKSAVASGSSKKTKE